MILEVKKEVVALLFPDRISEGVAEEKSQEGRWEVGASKLNESDPYRSAA